MACSSHTDESESKPSHATQGIFTLDALRATTLPIPGSRTGSECAGLHIQMIGYTIRRLYYIYKFHHYSLLLAPLGFKPMNCHTLPVTLTTRPSRWNIIPLHLHYILLKESMSTNNMKIICNWNVVECRTHLALRVVDYSRCQQCTWTKLYLNQLTTVTYQWNNEADTTECYFPQLQPSTKSCSNCNS